MTVMAAVLTAEYNCAHFFVDAWREETGEELAGSFAGLLTGVRSRRAPPALGRGFSRLPGPGEHPCLVLFRRRLATPHVGLYVRRRVLHLTDQGPIRQVLADAAMGYKSVRFYAPR